MVISVVIDCKRAGEKEERKIIKNCSKMIDDDKKKKIQRFDHDETDTEYRDIRKEGYVHELDITRKYGFDYIQLLLLPSLLLRCPFVCALNCNRPQPTYTAMYYSLAHNHHSKCS